MRTLLVAVALALASPGSRAVQDFSPAVAPASTYQPPVYRAGTELVRLDVSVTQRGRPVPALRAADFVVTDNGVVQRVESVMAEEIPLSVVMVLDTSASMEGEKLQRLEEAGQALIEMLRPSDRAAVVRFSNEVAVGAALTADREPVRAAVDSLRAGGPTALRDAIFVALQLRPADDSQPLVLVFSDGADTASWLTERETIDAVRRAGVTIHSVEIPETDRRQRVAPRFLEDIASASGGRRWVAGSSRDLRDLFRRALDEMRARYVISFQPQGVAREGWHELKVAVRGRPVDVKARPGYFVAAPTRP